MKLSHSVVFVTLALAGGVGGVQPAYGQMASAPASLKQEEVDEIGKSVMIAWATANKASDTDAVTGLYADNALFFGSGSKMFSGVDGIRAYFQAIPKGGVKDVIYSDIHVVQVAPQTLVAASYVDFHLNFNGKEEVRNWRIMLTLVQDAGGKWTIAGHHAAPKEQ